MSHQLSYGLDKGIISAHLLERKKKLMGDTESCHGLHELECQFRKRSDALQSLKAAAQRSPNQSAQHRLSQACRTKTESEKVAASSWHRTHPSVGSLHTFAISLIKKKLSFSSFPIPFSCLPLRHSFSLIRLVFASLHCQ